MYDVNKGAEMKKKQVRYDGVEGLRVYAILGIIIMHVLQNGNYNLNGWVYTDLIPRFGNFVFVCMAISGFGMCCGYYEKVKSNSISIDSFYKRRYNKVWPYFVLLCLIDVIVSPSVHSLYELLANMTLCQGLLPNPQIGVIGVSWTLGVIFVFYLLFPFYCFLIRDKKNALFAIVVALALNYLCSQYFFDASHMVDSFDSRQNIIYCAVYFLMGGCIYLFRDTFKGKTVRFFSGILTVMSVVLFAIFEPNTLIMLFMSATFLIYAISENGTGVLGNSFIKYVGKVVFEIYLCHMLIFRVLERMRIVNLFGKGVISFIFTVIFTICGSIAFAMVVQMMLKKIKRVFDKDE